MNREPVPRSLVEAAAKRTLDAEQRVRGALRALDADGATVSFAAVAKHARVSRAFLYAHTELRSEIEALRSIARPRRRGCPSASARATPRSVPGCGPRWMRTSVSAGDRRAARGARARARPRARAGALPPRRARTSVSWPAPARDAALHGIAGEFVTRTAPHTESDPMALLIQFLVAVGAAAGRNVHYRSKPPAITSTSTRS